MSARLRVDVLTIFPDLVEAYCEGSILGRARRNGLLDVRVHDVRSAATDPHRSVDDAPFGGGAGMVLAPEPVFAAVETVDPPRPLYLLSPGGRRFDQAVAEELAGVGRAAAGGAGAGAAGAGGAGAEAGAASAEGCSAYSLLCGRYEGVDQRIADHLVDGELSIGDYVLAGGELAALVVIEATARLVPGVLGNDESTSDESFADGLIEYPQYTRPAEFRGWVVPDVLRSGDHEQVQRWRRAQAIARTRERRPDLIERRGGLSERDRRDLEEFGLL